MRLHPLEHSLVLLGVMRDLPIKVRRKFDGTFAGVIDGSEPVHEEGKSTVGLVGFPLSDRLSQENRIQFAELKDKRCDCMT